MVGWRPGMPIKRGMRRNQIPITFLALHEDRQKCSAPACTPVFPRAISRRCPCRAAPCGNTLPRRGWTIPMQVREVGYRAAQREARQKQLQAARRRKISGQPKSGALSRSGLPCAEAGTRDVEFEGRFGRVSDSVAKRLNSSPYGAIYLGNGLESDWPETGSKIASMGWLKTRAILKASGRLGSYLPVSIAFTVWRDTWRRPASSACDQSRSARRTRSRFFMAR